MNEKELKQHLVDEYEQAIKRHMMNGVYSEDMCAIAAQQYVEGFEDGYRFLLQAVAKPENV